MNILITGGAGYIGSHIAVALSEVGHKIVLFDNFFNSDVSILRRLDKIIRKTLVCTSGDVRDTVLLRNVLHDHRIDAVIHPAGLKAVGESVKKPIDYFANNVNGAISLLEAMKSTNVKTLIFSSSATVYGDPQYLPIDENHPTVVTNPYGRSKLYIERMLMDVANSDPDWKIICLRYFNPVGAHESGLIGENPNGLPNNLMPYIGQVASGKLKQLSIYGIDYKTNDGTGVRDYIHVMDLAEGHLAALNYLQNHRGWDVFNLGTGHGASVLEVISSYQRASGRKIAYQITPRRAGDIASCYTQIDKSKKLLKWHARRTLDEMCKSSWLWENKVSQAIL